MCSLVPRVSRFLGCPGTRLVLRPRSVGRGLGRRLGSSTAARDQSGQASQDPGDRVREDPRLALHDAVLHVPQSALPDRRDHRATARLPDCHTMPTSAKPDAVRAATCQSAAPPGGEPHDVCHDLAQSDPTVTDRGRSAPPALPDVTLSSPHLLRRYGAPAGHAGGRGPRAIRRRRSNTSHCLGTGPPRR